MPMLALIASCTPTTNTHPTGTGTTLTGGENSGGIATVTKTDTVTLGTVASLNYTLREGNASGKVIETTDMVVAQANGIYQTGALYGPTDMEVTENSLIRGFRDNIIGMKVGEKKSFTVLPEDGYGVSGQEREYQKYEVAPRFEYTQKKENLGKTITETIEKTSLPESMLQELAGKKVGDPLVGPTGISATIRAITETGVTVEIENTNNPFYNKELVVGATGVDTQGNEYTIKKIEGDEVVLDILNKLTPFTEENFHVGSSVELQGTTLTIKAITDTGVTLEEKGPLIGKTLHFDVEIKDVKIGTLSPLGK